MLKSSTFLHVNGAVSAEGSGGMGIGIQYGGNGGDIILAYITVADTRNGIFQFSGGTGDIDGKNGSLFMKKRIQG